MYRFLLLIVPPALYYYKIIRNRNKYKQQQKTLSEIKEIQKCIINNISQFRTNLQRLNKTLDDYNSQIN